MGLEAVEQDQVEGGGTDGDLDDFVRDLKWWALALLDR
jgi:hypothetical protein